MAERQERPHDFEAVNLEAIAAALRQEAASIESEIEAIEETQVVGQNVLQLEFSI